MESEWKSVGDISRESGVKISVLRAAASRAGEAPGATDIFTVRGVTFEKRHNKAAAYALEMRIIERRECAVCEKTATSNRHRVLNGQVVCTACHHKAFLENDPHVRNVLGL